MEVRLLVVAGLVSCLVASPGCTLEPAEVRSPQSETIAPGLRYFAQPTPGTVPQLFAPGVVNTDAVELNGVFTPDGRQFLFTRLVDDMDTIYYSVVRDDRWTGPEPLRLFPGDTRALAVDMSVSPDGRLLYFLGRHPHLDAPTDPTYDIWVSRRTGSGWSVAEVVPAPVSTAAAELYPVVVADGSLYFSSDRPGGIGRSDIYRAQRLPDGRFAEPVNLGPPISNESGTGDTYVAPDESFLIFSSRRAGGFGAGDLWLSLRRPDGSWGQPTNLGGDINSDEHEFCPMLTPDGRHLFFSRLLGGSWENATDGEVYWVDARVLNLKWNTDQAD